MIFLDNAVSMNFANHCVSHFVGIEIYFLLKGCEVYLWIWIYERALATKPDLELTHSEAEFKITFFEKEFRKTAKLALVGDFFLSLAHMHVTKPFIWIWGKHDNLRL